MYASASPPAAHLMHACRQQLFDPASSKLFWFPEKPRGQPPHAAFRGSVLRQAAAGGTGGSCGTLAEDSVPVVPVVSAGAGADGGSGDDVPPRARNLLDLVPAASESQVDAARAAAAGATASQPVGMQLAAGRGPSFSSATEDITAQHRGTPPSLRHCPRPAWPPQSCMLRVGGNRRHLWWGSTVCAFTQPGPRNPPPHPPTPGPTS